MPDGLSTTCVRMLLELRSPDKSTRISALMELGNYQWAGHPHRLEELVRLTREEQAALFAAAAPLAKSSDDHEAALAIEAIGWFDLSAAGDLLATLTAAASPRIALETIRYLADKPQAARGLQAAFRLVEREPFQASDWSSADPSVLAASLVKYLEHPEPEVVVECRKLLAAFAARLTDLASANDAADAGQPLYAHHQIILMDNALMHILHTEWTLDDRARSTLYDSFLQVPSLTIAPCMALCDIYSRTGEIPANWAARLEKDASLQRCTADFILSNIHRRRHPDCDYGPLVSRIIRMMAPGMVRCGPMDFELLVRVCQATGRLDELHGLNLPDSAVFARMSLHWQKTGLTPAKALAALKKPGLLDGLPEKSLNKLRGARLTAGGPLEWLSRVMHGANRLFAFDTEAPDAPPDYRPILKELARISGGFLSEKGCTQRELETSILLSMQAGGRALDVGLPSEGDWIAWEPLLFALNGRLQETGHSARFLPLAADGQCLTIIFVNKPGWDQAAAALGVPVIQFESRGGSEQATA